MATDLESLLEMGFEKPRAELALKKSGGRKLNYLLLDVYPHVKFEAWLTPLSYPSTGSIRMA